MLKKNLLSLILALCLCFALAAPAWAADENTEIDEYNNNFQTNISIIPIVSNEDTSADKTDTDFADDAQTATFVIPVSSPENIYSIPIGYIKSEDNERSVESTIVWATLVRRNIFHDCELFINWSGNEVYESWKFSKCIVDNSEFINPIVYGKFLVWQKDVTASCIGSVRVGIVVIPDEVTQARVVFSDFKGYDLNKGMWRSIAMIPKLGDIQ